MRDMCVKKARQENFLQVIQHQENNFTLAESSPSLPETSKSRRIAIHHHVHSDDNLAGINSHLRSFLYFLDKYGMTGDQESFIFKNLRLLRVLKLHRVHGLPREIGNLIHLRHLGLRDCELIILPKSIGNLRSLYTLDLRGTSLGRPPKAPWKLECLTHLLVEGAGMHFRIDTLRHLETLKWIEAKNLIWKKALHKLTNLRNLGISFCRIEDVKLALNSPKFTLGYLRSLRLWSSQGFSFSNLQPISHCHHLTKLVLIGEIRSDMHSVCDSLEFLPTSLAKLVLRGSSLMQDPMGVLEKLPNLRHLCLGLSAYEGTKIVCSARGFPQLEFLRLELLSIIEEWRVEEGAIRCLKTLHILRLQKLRMIPEGLKSVTTLRELRLDMPYRFVSRVQVIEGKQGVDFYKVKHIPTISFLQRRLQQNPPSLSLVVR